MNLPDFYSLVPRQWQHNPVGVVEALPPPASTTPSATRPDNVNIRPRAASTNSDSSSPPPPLFTTTRTTPGWKSTSTISDPWFDNSSNTTPYITSTRIPYTSNTTSMPQKPTTATPTPEFDSTSSSLTPTLRPTTTTVPPPRSDTDDNKQDTGAILGAITVALVIMVALSLWYFRRKRVKKRARYGSAGPETWEDGEKGLHQARHQQQGHSGSPSPTLSFFGGNGYGHSDAYYQYDNNNINNNSLHYNSGLHNSNSVNRGPQNLHPEMMEEDMRSVKVYPQTLPNDTAVYWPPPPGPPQGIPSSSPPPPPFSSITAPVSPVLTESSASGLLKRSATRNPQDHRRQELLEHLLMQQHRQTRELQELQQQHQRENPLSGVSAPHAPTQEDRQIWHNSDRVQRQQWLQQQQPYHPGGNSRGGIIVSGPVGAVRDPQDWGVVDEEPHRQDERRVVMQEGAGADGEDGQQSLRAYIAQMKAEYEEQFRKHQEELDRLRAEQETQLQMLREQIKE